MSSSYKMIGSISEGLNKGDFDWVINICSDKILEEFDVVKSPTFSFASIPWYFEMGYNKSLKEDYISVHLCKEDMKVRKCLNFSFKMIFLGKELGITRDVSCIFSENTLAYGSNEFVTRKRLLDYWTKASKICGEVIVRIKLREHVPRDEDALFKIRLKEKEILNQNFKELLIDGEDHDLVFKVNDKEFKAHRIIMKSRCPVFKSMLKHEMLEKNSGVVEIPDCDPSAFEQFLLYIYTGELNRPDESVILGLYYIADKYDMENLREECCAFIKKSLSVNVVCDVIKLALDHSDSALLDFATKYFVSNAKEIFVTLEWMRFMKENPNQANDLIIKATEKISYCSCRSKDGASDLKKKEHFNHWELSWE